MRQVKCFVTGEIGDAKDFYWNFVGKTKKYFKNEETYKQYIKEKEDKEICIKFLLNIIGLDFSSTLQKEIIALHNAYTYDIILLTAQESKNSIEWAISNKLSDANEYQKVRYIMAIIKNNISNISNRSKRVSIQRHAEVEINVLNQTQFIVHKAKDLSDFLEDE